MIRRILVALDPDDDTPVATRYAIELAKRLDSSLTGLAVVDTSNIYPTSMVGDMEDTYYARNMWDELDEETKKMAGSLLDRFRSSVKQEGVRYTALRNEGASSDRIIEGMKYHDLLIVGRDSHFFYNEPKKETKTLAKVVKDGVSPTLVITDRYHEINKVLIAYDGSAPAARSVKSFAHLKPFGRDLEIELIYVIGKETDELTDMAESTLELARYYLREHLFTDITCTVLTDSRPGNQIIERQMVTGADLVVMGAHSVSALRRITFGSSTDHLIRHTDKPLFLTP